MLLLDENLVSLCGGTLIQENLVLTAAHCLTSSLFNNDTTNVKRVVAKGNIKYDWKKDRLESADATSEAVEFFIHPKYPEGDGNDIAIIRLKTSRPLPGPFAKLAKSSRTTKPVPPVGTSMTAVGMGLNNNYLNKTESDFGDWISSRAPRLYQVELEVGSPGVPPCPSAKAVPKDCMKPGENLSKLDCMRMSPKEELCLVGDWFYGYNPNTQTGVGLKSACSGDSGGPLYYKDVQYGVTSTGLDIPGCKYLSSNPYTVFTRVSAHRKSFIDPIVKANPYKKKKD